MSGYRVWWRWWIVMGTLLGMALLFPKEGIDLGILGVWRFFKPEDILPERQKPSAARQVISTATDTARITRLAPERLVGRRWKAAEPGRLQYPDDNPSALEPFFRLLARLAENPGNAADSVFHILHYGDSQIESDRISGYLRHRLQGLFGGSGAGLIPAVQTVPARNVRQIASNNWYRYTLYGPAENRAPDKRYGVLMSRSQYIGDTASLHLFRSATGYPGVRKLQLVRLFYSGPDSACELTIQDADGIQTFTLQADSARQSRTLEVPVRWNANGLKLFFKGPSPEVYGLSLEGEPGLQVDNIPMRGASGTFFRAGDARLLSHQLQELNVCLFILEFGGNTLPHIQSPEEVTRYARTMEDQFRFLLRLRPQACLVVIGPADMAVRINGRLETHPFLEALRDELRSATLRAGGVYWDMYAAMGGPRSMPVWAAASPPLAAPDFIHFTPAGAEKIAGMFTAALVDDFNLWLSEQKP
ncbi:MAG: hypothetical protein N2110_04100 [Flavobacteriales bacterium]|nr:hypothetical protein [Flavobacteriales bacterium]